MAYSQRRDFLFCNYCGTMLNMESKFVMCPLCKFKRNTKGIAVEHLVVAICHFMFLNNVNHLEQISFQLEFKIRWSSVVGFMEA